MKVSITPVLFGIVSLGLATSALGVPTLMCGKTQIKLGDSFEKVVQACGQNQGTTNSPIKSTSQKKLYYQVEKGMIFLKFNHKGQLKDVKMFKKF